MKVYLAAQVFSNRVACALTVQGNTGTKETAKFVKHMNDFFYCLIANKVQTKFESRSVYHAPDNHRLVWLKNVFLKSFQNWKKLAMSQTDVSERNVRSILSVIRHGRAYRFV